jgi:ABC-type Zn uptake system ZnuABC Zn-binding protein ZnuA
MKYPLWLLAACLLAGCSKAQSENFSKVPGTPVPSPTRRLLVMATIAPMYCFTKNVAGDLADVEMIVPPGVDGGAFQPTPDQTKHILEADVIVENGFGFEGWMDKIEAQGLKQGAIRVLASRGTGPGIPGLQGDPDSPPAGDQQLYFGEPVPHVWLDPVMAIKEVQNIRDALMARDPANADQYLANENHYEAALRDLDDEVGQATVDITKRKLVCWDDSFNYFLSRYQFTVTDVIDAEYPKHVVTEKGDALLAPIGLSSPLLNVLHLPIVRADPMQSGSASTDFYMQTTRANVAALRQGLSR